MKLIFLVLVTVSVAKAVEFNVTSSDNKTCLKLQLGGQVSIIAPENQNLLLDLDTATKNNESNCTFIGLNLNNSVQVGFIFSETKDQYWSVTPVIEFIPKDVFPGKFNESDRVTYQTQELDRFRRNESYECVSSITRVFVEGKQHEVNINVTAVRHNFWIQSLDGDVFVEGVRCKEDASTTAVPSTTAVQSTTHASTTPTPSFTQDVICEDNSTMKLRVFGALKLDITYNIADKKTKHIIVQVPAAFPDRFETNCSSSSLETLVIPFFVNWSIGFNFSRDGDKKYYVSGVVVNYVHDEHLPGTIDFGKKGEANFTSFNFLEASSGSYYYCKARVEQQLGESMVRLITTDLKYQAFNEKGNITFTGKVSECKSDEDSSSVVPIAVGAALAGLVVIVLIAYLIGRRRSRKAGYESV